LKRSYRQFDEINKNFNKIDNEIKIQKLQLENLDRNIQVNAENVTAQFEMVQKTIDLDRAKVSEIRGILKKYDENILIYQKK
jgi:hypothetical protein